MLNPCLHLGLFTRIVNVTVFASGTFHLFYGHFERMEVQPILPVKVSATIDTMLSFDGDFDNASNVTCKQTFSGSVKIFVRESFGL